MRKMGRIARGLGTVIRVFLAYVFIILVYVLTTYMSFMMYQPNPEAVQRVTTVLNRLLSQVLRQGPIAIFFHNLVLATMMSLPFIGPGNTIMIAINTGRDAGIIAASTYGQSVGMFSLAMTIVMTTLLPHAILEFLAYAIALENSITLTLKFLKFEFSRRDLVYGIFKYIMTATLLFIAAILEYTFIISLRTL